MTYSEGGNISITHKTTLWVIRRFEEMGGVGITITDTHTHTHAATHTHRHRHTHCPMFIASKKLADFGRPPRLCCARHVLC